MPQRSPGAENSRAFCFFPCPASGGTRIGFDKREASLRRNEQSVGTSVLFGKCEMQTRDRMQVVESRGPGLRPAGIYPPCR